MYSARPSLSTTRYVHSVRRARDGHCSAPLLGVHSVKTKAKLLPPPVEQSRAGHSVAGGERASKRAQRKRRRKEAGSEDEYEDALRKAVTWDEEAESSVRQLLPVKTKRGLVLQSTSVRTPETVSSETANERDEIEGGVDDVTVEDEVETEEEKEDEEEEEEEAERWSENGAKSTVELLASRQRKLQEKKALIAATSAKLLESPEENVCMHTTETVYMASMCDGCHALKRMCVCLVFRLCLLCRLGS